MTRRSDCIASTVVGTHLAQNINRIPQCHVLNFQADLSVARLWFLFIAA